MHEQLQIQNALEGADQSGASLPRMHAVCLQGALKFPPALFRVWLRAQAALLLPMAQLAKEDILQVRLMFRNVSYLWDLWD